MLLSFAEKEGDKVLPPSRRRPIRVLLSPVEGEGDRVLPSLIEGGIKNASLPC